MVLFETWGRVLSKLPKVWLGRAPLVIGVVDDAGNVTERIIIQPGEKIPQRAHDIADGTDDPLMVPYRKEYTDGNVKVQHHRRNIGVQ